MSGIGDAHALAVENARRTADVKLDLVEIELRLSFGRCSCHGFLRAGILVELGKRAKAATDKLVSRGFSRKNTDENRANCAKNKFNDCLFSMAWEKIVLKQLIPNIVTAIHFSRKELYLQPVAHSLISQYRGRFKDHLENGRGTGPDRSSPANLTARRGRVSLSSETSPVSGIKQIASGSHAKSVRPGNESNHVSAE